MHTTKLGDTTVYVEAAGTGETVVLLHCSASSSAQWRKLSTQMADRFHVVAPDLYGYGKTDPWPGHGPLTLADEAALVTEAIADVEGPVHLVGHSYGGAVALQIAIERPERLRSLTLIEPVAFYLLRHGGLMERTLFDEIGALADTISRAVLSGDYHGGMACFVDFWNGAGAWTKVKDETRTALARQVGKVALDFGATTRAPTPLDAIRAMGVPTLILCGQESPMATFAIANMLAEMVTPAHLMMVADAGHMMPMTHPEAVRDAIVEHVRTTNESTARTGRWPWAA